MAEGKKELATKVVEALLAANPRKLNSSDRAVQEKAGKNSKNKQNTIEFYAGRVYNEDKLNTLLKKFKDAE